MINKIFAFNQIIQIWSFIFLNKKKRFSIIPKKIKKTNTSLLNHTQNKKKYKRPKILHNQPEKSNHNLTIRFMYRLMNG